MNPTIKSAATTTISHQVLYMDSTSIKRRTLIQNKHNREVQIQGNWI